MKNSKNISVTPSRATLAKLVAVVIGALAFSHAATSHAAAFAFDQRNGAWGVALSSESNQIDRARGRAVDRGGRLSNLIADHSNSTRGKYVSCVIGWTGSKYIGQWRAGVTQAQADAAAIGGIRAGGAQNYAVVKRFFDN